MGGVKYIGYIIPVALTLVALEWLISRLRGKEVYRFNDTMVNMCCGLLERTFDFFFVVLLHFMFEFIYENFTVFKIPSNLFTWVLALLIADFLAYWHHRLSHEINFLWAAHIVHHQSETLNLTTVFRVSAFAVVNRAFFFIWLPLIGFSPAMSTSAIIFIGLFQFLTHSRLIGKLGFLEYIFVTPSSHRVHHGCDPKYIDKNYGHVFIIWDRILGTYREEEEEPDYGITEGFESANPYWAYLSYWVSLFSRAIKMQNWKDGLMLFIKPPSWRSNDLPISALHNKTKENREKNNREWSLPLELRFYIFINVLLTVFSFAALLINKADFSNQIIAAIILGIAYSVFTMGLLMERRWIGWLLEFVRLSLLIFSITMLYEKFSNPIYLNVIIGLLSMFILWLFRLKIHFKSIGARELMNAFVRW